MTRTVIVATARTPIGRATKGVLTNVRADDLGALAIEALLSKVPDLERELIDDVIWGTAVPEREQGMNVARNVSMLAGLPDTVPGMTVNRFCASSLQAIRVAFHAIEAGEGEVFIAGGVDCFSRVGTGVFEPEDKNPRFVDSSRPDYVNDMFIAMIDTAENVAAERGISRERADAYALESHRRAVRAQESGFFAREITPVPLPDGAVMTMDECPRPTTSLEQLATLEPIRPRGVVTAGNSCPLNDGAAAVLVMSERRAEALGLQPFVRVLATAVGGVAPEVMGVGPTVAIPKVLAMTGLSIGDIDIVELNEAFAVQVLAVCDEVGISVEHQLNPQGGATALGHPFGQTGARIMTTLINGLETHDARYGMETMCIGGGMGMAAIVERI